MRLYKRLRRKLHYLTETQKEQVHQAYLTALEAHRGQTRLSGEPYITHPVAVACILADLVLDHQSVMAALLHDVIEDTPVSKTVLEEKFGHEVAELVDGVSKLTQIEFVSRAEAQAENFRKMVLAMAKDLRVILIKLADRLHNMRTLDMVPADKKRRKGRETLEIFAPVAKRLGMRELSVELEELGFKALYPKRYAILKEAVRQVRGNRKKILNLIEKRLHDGLSLSNLTSFMIAGREKHLYSIYRKMRNKLIPFNDIMDVYAFRIIVDDIDSCYRVLGIVHSLYKPVPERFKDYIAIPKANGYQSLHTTLFGPYGLPIEIQIRTREMDLMATSGIAAHWVYKSEELAVKESRFRAQEWVKNLLELQQRAGNSLEFFESVKVDLFPDEVYVFTPKGEILELPGGATAVDFAYAVHTDVGNSCTAVKIDRQLAPLSSVLSSGQTVEVITSSRGRPNPAWLDFIVTSKARSSVRHYLKNQKIEESIALGRELLRKALNSHGLSFKKIPNSVWEYIFKEAQLEGLDHLLSELGLGNRISSLVAQHISDLIHQMSEKELITLTPEPQAPLLIKGTEGLVVKFADCCYPIPGDPIAGVLSAGKGIMVHIEKCQRIIKLRRHPDRCMALRWAEGIKKDFLVALQVQVVNQRGVLAFMALAISDADGNIDDIIVKERDGQYYIVVFKLMVHNRAHLARIIRSLRQVPQLIKITRISQ